MTKTCWGVIAICIVAALSAGCATVYGPVTTTGGFTVHSQDDRVSLECDLKPDPGADWPRPGGGAFAYVRFDHSQWLAISTAYRKGPSDYRLLLIGPNRGWSLEFDHHAPPSNLVGAWFGLPTLVLDAVDAVVHSSPEARSLMDASTQLIVGRMVTAGTMPVEAVASGRRSLYGTLTFHPKQESHGATQPATQPVLPPGRSDAGNGYAEFRGLAQVSWSGVPPHAGR